MPALHDPSVTSIAACAPGRRRCSIGAVLVMVVSGLISSPAHAKDWPEFRGPTGQGIVREGTLPLEWSATRNVAWKQAIPGKGWSSPVVYDGRIYLTTSVPVAASREGDQSLQAICLDARTGKIQWAKEVIRQDGKTAPPIHNKNSHASPTPIVDGERLYVHFGHQGTACLDLSGEVLWRNTNLKYAPVHGNGGSPILAGDALVVSCDGGDQQFVVALNRATGRVMWKRKRGIEAPKKFAFSTPLLITVDGRQQVVSPGAAAVGAYDPSTGREIWRVRYDGYSVIPRPVYAHGLVFVSTGYETPSLLAIRPEGRGDVTETHVAWRTRRGVPHSASLVVAGDQLYMVSDAGVASCLDARTGRLHWQERLGGTYSSSPLVADGRIYFQSEDGTAVIIKAGTQFQQLARNELGERTLASYAVVDGALFIRTEENLYRIEAR